MVPLWAQLELVVEMVVPQLVVGQVPPVELERLVIQALLLVVGELLVPHSESSLAAQSAQLIHLTVQQMQSTPFFRSLVVRIVVT